jgi:hypothetical protein
LLRGSSDLEPGEPAHQPVQPKLIITVKVDPKI